MRVDLEDLGFEQGGSLLVKRALRSLSAGQALTVTGTAPDLPVHLRAWCRTEGHDFMPSDAVSAVVVKGRAPDERWSGAERAGAADPFQPGAVLERPHNDGGLLHEEHSLNPVRPSSTSHWLTRRKSGQRTRCGYTRRLPPPSGIPLLQFPGTACSIYRTK